MRRAIVMLRQRFILIALLLCGSVGFFAQSRAAEFEDGFESMQSPEPANLAGITAQHNSVRSAVVTIPPLLPLAWSPTLAATAQAWANQCRDLQAPARPDRPQSEP